MLIKDRIADSMFQQILLRPDEYDVFATPNLNGDYLSDACAAQVGGLGMAPGANIGDDGGDLRGDARHGAEVRRQGRDQPRVGDPVGRDDAAVPGLGRGGGPHRDGDRSDDHRSRSG